MRTQRYYIHQSQWLTVALRACEIRPHKTLYDRLKRWNDNGIVARMMQGQAKDNVEKKTVMIDATYPKAYRLANSLGFKKEDLDA